MEHSTFRFRSYGRQTVVAMTRPRSGERSYDPVTCKKCCKRCMHRAWHVIGGGKKRQGGSLLHLTNPILTFEKALRTL